MTRAAEGNERLVSRFYAEARAVARLQHPNIVTCFDAGRYQKPGPHPQHSYYFVMELIAGHDLFHLVRKKARSPHSGPATCSVKLPRRWRKHTGTV